MFILYTLIIIQFSKTYFLLHTDFVLIHFNTLKQGCQVFAQLFLTLVYTLLKSGGGGRFRTAEPLGSRFTVCRV